MQPLPQFAPAMFGPGRGKTFRSRAHSAVFYFAFILLLVGCFGETTPTPTPTATARSAATAVPVAAATTAPSTPTALATALPTVTVASAGATTSVAASTTAQLTTTQTTTGSGTPVFLPAVLKENGDCLQTPDLDLAGYPAWREKLGCPLGTANFDPIAINEFGAGPEFDRFMLWLGSEKKIYTLLPTARWQSEADTWSEDQPIFACNPLGGEATSPPLPRRGFGKLWCSNAQLQTILGTITVEERLCQHSVLQAFEHGRLLACYEDATIRYFRLFTDGTWDQLLSR